MKFWILHTEANTTACDLFNYLSHAMLRLKPMALVSISHKTPQLNDLCLCVSYFLAERFDRETRLFFFSSPFNFSPKFSLTTKLEPHQTGVN